MVTAALTESGFSIGDITDELLDSFFEAEVEMERKICRDVVCTSRKDEEGKKHLIESSHTHTPEQLLPAKHMLCVCVCQVFSGTCASCSCICYYLLEISTTRTCDTSSE